MLRDLILINVANHTLGTGFEFESGYGLFLSFNETLFHYF